MGSMMNENDTPFYRAFRVASQHGLSRDAERAIASAITAAHNAAVVECAEWISRNTQPGSVLPSGVRSLMIMGGNIGNDS